MSLPPQQFCVRWNSYHTNLQTVFPKLLSTENFVDVTLACENRQIKCHKVVLSACSTYFERLLIQNPCKHPIIFMKDMRFSEMQSLVDFMYKGEVNVSQDDLPSLLKSAEALQIRGLCGSDGSGSGGGDSQETNTPQESRSTVNHPKEVSSHNVSESPKEGLKSSSSNEHSSQNSTNESAFNNSSTHTLSVSKKRKDQGTSPESQTEYRGPRKSGDLAFKEEMVEEDGLFYGEMENDEDCNEQIDEEMVPNSSTGGQQTSGYCEKVRTRKRKKVLSSNAANSKDPIVAKLQQCSKISVKMLNSKKTAKKKTENIVNCSENVNDNELNSVELTVVDDSENNIENSTKDEIVTNNSNERVGSLIISDESEIDHLIYENEDFLKQWLLKNHELEVSFSSTDTNSNSKYNERHNYQKRNCDANSILPFKTNPAFSEASIMSEKNWLQNLHELSNDQIDTKDGIIKSVDKSLKRKIKSAGIEEMAAFLEPSDLDQFLAGKEVSSSGISRKAIEQAMMGKYNPNRRYSNQAMWAALMDVKKGGSIYRAAQTHKVPRKSLRNWMKRWHIKSSFPMPQQLKQFVENNRKHKMELRREFTNTLLSLGSRLNMSTEDVLSLKNQNENQNNELYRNDADEVEDTKKDDIKEDANTNQSEYLDCDEIIDMSGNVLYDEDIAHVTMNSDCNNLFNEDASSPSKDNNSLTKHSIMKKQILFSDVEQLAGLDKPKTDENCHETAIPTSVGNND